jgi:hypothetical protein
MAVLALLAASCDRGAEPAGKSASEDAERKRAAKEEAELRRDLAEMHDRLVYAPRWTGVHEIVACTAFIYGVAYEPRALEVWEWQEGVLRRGPYVDLARGEYQALWAGDGRYLVYRHHPETGAPELQLRIAETGEVVGHWPIRRGWWCSEIGHSRNGRYVAAATEAEGASPIAPRVDLLVLDLEALTLSGPVTLQGGEDTGGMLSSVMPSDDGTHVAVCGWDNGVAMVAMDQAKVLWAKRPPRVITIRRAVFGPGGDVLYTGGWAHEMRVEDGKVLRRWGLTADGKSPEGEGASAICFSPDGRYMAAAGGGKGRIVLMSADTGEVHAVMQHGGATVYTLAFSPDSSALVSYGAKHLRIWRIADITGPGPGGDDPEPPFEFVTWPKVNRGRIEALRLGMSIEEVWAALGQTIVPESPALVYGAEGGGDYYIEFGGPGDTSTASPGLSAAIYIPHPDSSECVYVLPADKRGQTWRAEDDAWPEAEAKD